MKLPSIKFAAVFCILSVAVFATAVTDFKEYLPINQRTDQNVSMWNTLLALFTQKAGDTMTGDLVFPINTDAKVTAGTVGAQGLVGKLAFQTGVLDVISNANVAASSVCFITKADVTPPIVNNYIVTNMVGIGFRVIPATVSTNSLNFRIILPN